MANYLERLETGRLRMILEQMEERVVFDAIPVRGKGPAQSRNDAKGSRCDLPDQGTEIELFRSATTSNGRHS